MTSASLTPRILIVEDEPKLAAVLADYLQLDGFRTTTIADGRDVIPHIRNDPPAVLLLDLMLPGRNGMDICRELRQFSSLPVIILTARVDEIDRLLGLELGADDYVCKPFSPREVVARVKAILRRIALTQDASAPTSTIGSASPSAQNAQDSTTNRDDAPAPSLASSASASTTPSTQSDSPIMAANGALCVDEARHSAKLDGVELKLTPVELRLLALLARSPGRIFQRDYLLGHLYSDHRVVTDRTIDSHVKNLRRKLNAIRPEHDPITSVYGVGYRLDL